MDKKSLMKAFNSHLMDFVDDVVRIFPNDVDVQTCKTFLQGIKKVNPKKIIYVWHERITLKYENQIMSNDYDYFENKKYDNDVYNNKTIIGQIENIRNKVKHTSMDNKKKSMKYMQNLIKLSKLYFN